MANGTLKVGTITTSTGSGNIHIGSGVTLQSNVPAFEAYLSTDQSSITSATLTKVQFANTHFDTNSNYSTTNYRFTPSEAGKYFFYSYFIYFFFVLFFFFSSFFLGLKTPNSINLNLLTKCSASTSVLL